MLKPLLLAGILLLSAHASAQLDHPNLHHATFVSNVLEKTMDYYIYVPETTDPEERFPVVYLLHGKTQTSNAWPEHMNATTAAEKHRMILVFPGGAKNSWYLDSPVLEDSQYFTYLTEDLIEHVDDTWPTKSERTSRAIMGLSMGGHGAFLAAERRPDLYISASSLSGVLKITDHPDRPSIEERLGSYENFPERWEENSVFENAEKLKDNGVSLFFDCGAQDTERGMIYDNRKFHARLLELDIPHLWKENEGAHTWSYWRAHLPEHLEFHAEIFASHQGED